MTRKNVISLTSEELSLAAIEYAQRNKIMPSNVKKTIFTVKIEPTTTTVSGYRVKEAEIVYNE